ncbi:MAG: hypothetical protein IJ141_01535 [Lachnospiraceae bacterium]|nr:hypothetical protein [Lachnospiraceae bacterium]
MKKSFFKTPAKKLTSICIAAAMALGVISISDTKLDVKAAFDAPHYDIDINNDYWNGTEYIRSGNLVTDAFFCDSKYTWFLQADGTPMKDRLTYHPDGEHVIYFDAYGHETFSTFRHVKNSIAGDPVDDLCFFDVNGYMYVNFLTYDQAGVNLYYANPYGVMECNGWFQFAGEAGPVADAFGITEGTYGYAYPCGIVDPASIGGADKLSTFTPNPDYNYPYSDDLGVDDSSFYFIHSNGVPGWGYVDASQYTYEVIPLLEPFNQYFYIKTDNPDPHSFMFVDKDTIYSDEEAGIRPLYPGNCYSFDDVEYENINTHRVNGGYLAHSSRNNSFGRSTSPVDGGELTLKKFQIDEELSEKYKTLTYGYFDTDIKVTIPKLVDDVDYLIETYGDNDKDFFDNLRGIESGLDSICYYSDFYINGKQVRKDNQYAGIATAIFPEQALMILQPYKEVDKGVMFMSSLYPYKLNSSTFPQMMVEVAKRIHPDITYEDVPNMHWVYRISYDGRSGSYGGQGSGGKGINSNQLAHKYAFDGSSNDACSYDNLQAVYNKLYTYEELEVPDNSIIDLTWADVRSDVDNEGKYVRIYNAKGGTAYTYLYNGGGTSEGDIYNPGIGYISNAWFDGRFFNNFEIIESGISFEESIENAKANNQQVPSIVMKDFYRPISDDVDDTWEWEGYKLSELGYDKETGFWSGAMLFIYDSESNSWKMHSYKPYNGFNYVNSFGLFYKENGIKIYYNESPFADSMTITMDEALSMELDKNTNVDPEEFLIYDMTVEPGTKGTN